MAEAEEIPASAGRARGGPWPHLVDRLREFTDTQPGLAEEMVRRVQALPAYGEGGIVPRATLLASCAAHIAFMRNAGSGDAAEGPRANGADRARAGIPIATVLSAYRIGSQLIWERLAQHARRTGASPDELVDLATEVWLMHAEFAAAMERGWHEADRVRLAQSQRERSSIVDTVVRSTPDSAAQLWEAIDRIGLPRTGDYVVTVITMSHVGIDPLPGIERRLERQHIQSAWLLRAEMLVGLVSLSTPGSEPALLHELRSSGATCGISPRKDDYAEGAQAFRFAAAALAASPAGRTTQFHQTPVAVAVASAPDVAREIATEVLGQVLALDEDERASLLNTLRAWFVEGGSTARTAAALYLHPNTVRNRLHRLEALTGRNLTAPADTAELALAIGAIDLR